MPLTPAEMDGLMNRHFAYEMNDDVDGVLATLSPDAEHDIVGAPHGSTVGHVRTRPTYEQVFADLAGDRVETLHRYYGHNALTDESLWIGRAVGSPLGIPGYGRPLSFRILHVMEFAESGLIIRENVWIDQNAIVSQLTDDHTQTNTIQKEQHHPERGSAMSQTPNTTSTANKDLWFEGAFMRVLVDTKDSGGVISMMEHWYPAEWSPPLHVHHREDQVLHVLEGEIRAGGANGDETTLAAGESVFLPRDVPHTFITGASGAKILEINTPGGFEQFHVEAGEPALEQRIPDAKEVDVPKLIAAIEPYEAEFVGPPMS